MDMFSASSEVVLLTAAVNPSPDVPFTSLAADTRLPLYRNSIAWWSDQARRNGWHLYVIETTGASEDELFSSEKPAPHLTFRSFTPPSKLNVLGKGALESACLDFAFSEITELFSAETTVHKITGRLIVKNCSKILSPIPRNSIRLRRTLDRSYSDSRVFSVSAGTWAHHFERIHDEVNDLNSKRYFEHVLSQRIILGEYAGNLHVSQFARLPSVRGLSGTTGNPYGGLTWDGWNNAKDIIEQNLYKRYPTRLL